jgi:LacI family transcriptional regulator
MIAMETAPPTPQRPRRATMSEVAARAGVSMKSVSRVVNGEAHVSPDLATRVEAAIAELGYRPDRRARGLAATPSPRTIGYVQVDAANPFFARVYRGVEDVLQRRGLVMIAGSTDGEAARERQLLETLIEFRVDGLVVAAAAGSDDLVRHEVSQGTPLVCIDRVLEDLPCDTVVSSNRDSSRAAVRHLFDRGHAHVVCLAGDPSVWTAAERLAGYHEACAEVAVDPWVVTGVDTVEKAAAATRVLLDDPAFAPTAIFSAQDRITAGALTALHERGRQHDVALFGFDEIPFAEQLDPSVSVVAQDPYGMGRRAAERLLRRLDDASAPPQLDVIDAPLRHRRSGDLRPS